MMETKYIDIDGYWGIIVCYDFSREDADDMWAIMRSFGMNNKQANKALHVLSSVNTGMCVSNHDIRMSAVFISRATSSSEWWSSAIHEATHAADAILDFYGADWHGEEAAYLTGYITKQMVEIIGEPCN